MAHSLRSRRAFALVVAFTLSTHACGSSDGAVTARNATPPPGSFLSATSPSPGSTEPSSPTTSGPHPRGYALMTPGPGDSIMLLGGFDCPSCDPDFSGFGDMWAFNSDGIWSDITPPIIPPGGDAFAYDIGSDRAVFVEIGGVTWAYDPTPRKWQRLDVAELPGALHGSRMVYDAGSDRLIVFGGDDFSAASAHNETWAFDLEGGAWELMSPRDPPPRRTYYAMAYDASSDRVILFGGGGADVGGPFGDTWAYDYDTDVWELMSPAESPPARVYAAAAYDSNEDRVIIYGGSVDEERAAFQDTWAYDYDTDTWTMVADEAPMGPLAWHAMAYGLAGVVLFGGGLTRDEYVADVWRFDAATTSWIPVS